MATDPKKPVEFTFGTVHLIAFIFLLLMLGYMVGATAQRQWDTQETQHVR